MRVTAETHQLLRVVGCQVAHAFVIPVTKVLLIPVGIDPGSQAKLIRNRVAGLDCASQARGDHGGRTVTDEHSDTGSSGTGLAPTLCVQRGVRTPSPV